MMQQRAKELHPGSPFDPDTDLAIGTGSIDGLEFLPFTTIDEALLLANASPCGLSASIWTGDLDRADRVARHLEAGMVWINDASAAEPRFPWGGRRSSGWGRLFVRESLASLTQMKAISCESGAGGRKPWWFPYSGSTLRRVEAAGYIAFGRKDRTWIARLAELPAVLFTTWKGGR
jgi:hypothetical protein